MYEFSNSILFGGFKELDDLSDEEKSEYVIINLSKRNREDSDYWIPLNDGVYDNGGNTQQEFAEAVNKIREYINSKNKIFVHCAVGQSRSVSVLATAIAAENNLEFNDVLHELLIIRNIDSKPSSSLINKSEVYLRHT